MSIKKNLVAWFLVYVICLTIGLLSNVLFKQYNHKTVNSLSTCKVGEIFILRPSMNKYICVESNTFVEVR